MQLNIVLYLAFLHRTITFHWWLLLLALKEEDLKFGKTLSLQVDAITDKVYVVFHLYGPFMFFSQLTPLTCKASSFFRNRVSIDVQGIYLTHKEYS
jgi:hypothetical protein